MWVTLPTNLITIQNEGFITLICAYTGALSAKNRRCGLEIKVGTSTFLTEIYQITVYLECF